MKAFKTIDTLLGVTIFIGGILTLSQGFTFDESSRSYPITLSLIVIIIAMSIIYLSLVNKTVHMETISDLYARSKGVLVISAIMVGWALLLNLGAGYITSSLLLVALMLYFLELVNIKNLIGITVLVVFFIFTLFYVLFDIPLPVDYFTNSVLN